MGEEGEGEERTGLTSGRRGGRPQNNDMTKQSLTMGHFHVKHHLHTSAVFSTSKPLLSAIALSDLPLPSRHTGLSHSPCR